MLRESLLAEQFLGEKLRLRLNHTREYCGHFGLCGLDGLIVPKPSHHLEPAGVVRKPRLVASYLAVHTEGKRDVGRLSRYDAVEFRGSDANDGVKFTAKPAIERIGKRRTAVRLTELCELHQPFGFVNRHHAQQDCVD